MIAAVGTIMEEQRYIAEEPKDGRRRRSNGAREIQGAIDGMSTENTRCSLRAPQEKSPFSSSSSLSYWLSLNFCFYPPRARLERDE